MPSIGLAGSGSLRADCGAQAALMPAGGGFQPGGCVRLSLGVGHVSLQPVEGVQRVDGSDEAMPDVTVQPFGGTFDVAVAFGPWVKATAWINLPIPYLYFHDSKDPWVPYAVRWQNRYARGMGAAALVIRLPLAGVPAKVGDRALRGGAFVSAGVSLRPRGRIGIDLDLVGRADGDDRVIDVILRDVDLVALPVLRPEVSFALDLGTFTPALDGLRIGATWRAESITAIDPIALDVQVQGLDELAQLFALVDELRAQVWLGLVDFYDPHQVRAAVAWSHPRLFVEADVQWNQWSRIGASYARVVQGPDGQDGTLVLDTNLENAEGEDLVYTYPVVNGRDVDQAMFRDTVDVSLGVGVPLPELATRGGPVGAELRFGYRYQPRLLRPSSGPGALLDGDVHSGAFGIGLRAPAPAVRGPLRFDLGVQVLGIGGLDLPKPAETGQDRSGFPVIWSGDARWGGGVAVFGGGSVGVDF